jgi:hypothetical protein
MSKEFLDWSTVTGAGSGLEMLSNSVRKGIHYDVFEDVTRFEARVLTDAFPLSEKEAQAFVGADRPTIDPASENLREKAAGVASAAGGYVKGVFGNIFSVDDEPESTPELPEGSGYARYIFKARIINHPNSPHAFIPDPCDDAFIECPQKALPYVIMHTSFVSTVDSNSEDASTIKKGDVVIVELSRNEFSFNLQFGKFVKRQSTAVQNLAQRRLQQEAAECKSLDNLFKDSPSVGSVGPARSVAAYEKRYSYACRASGPYDAEIRALAARLGIEPAVICAFRAVESGLLPPNALRFEPHVFLRYLPDLAGQIPYTRGDVHCPESRKGACVNFVSYVPTETGKAAFDHAFALNPGIAIKSSSFGLFQIVGFNFPSTASPAIANYQTAPQAFLNYMNEDPVAFSFEIVEVWFRANPRALQAAKTHDWLTLAMVYNGTEAAAQDYQLKLEAAYNVAASDCYGTAVASAD